MKRRLKQIRVLILALIIFGYLYGICKLIVKIEAPTLIVPYELPSIEKEKKEIPIVVETYKSLGKFKITYYCPGACCNGSNAGLDCKGHPLREGTIATNDLPYGTVVYIKTKEGLKEYTVRDRMAKKKRPMPAIDILVMNTPHNIVQDMGVDYFEVFVKE